MSKFKCFLINIFLHYNNLYKTDVYMYLLCSTSLIRVASVPVNLPIEMKSAMVIPINRPGIQSSAKLFFLPQGVLKNAQEVSYKNDTCVYVCMYHE